MIFATQWFLLFAALSVGLFWLLPWAAARLWFLAAACVLFHAHFAGPAGVLPIAILMTLSYAAGLAKRPAARLAAIAICVAALCLYKYAVFLSAAAVAPISPALADSLGVQIRSIMPGAPPLAVSFFTFEFVHYLYEVHKGGEPIRNPLKFLLFSVFFPSLVAGPIKRYSQFLPSLESAVQRRVSGGDFAGGLARIAVGFSKKLLIADNLTFYIEHLQASFTEMEIVTRWALLGMISIRILLDFSGYSDIAIGCARLLGIRLPENFDWPYLAVNLQEFWQRWHISLSTWIRDYVYIPLGGSRRGPSRRVLNGLIAFSLCGLWHGPAWNFVLWGLWHGVGLAACATCSSWPRVGTGLARVFARAPLAAWALTQGYVTFGWLLFFYPANQAWRMGRLLFGLS